MLEVLRSIRENYDGDYTFIDLLDIDIETEFIYSYFKSIFSGKKPPNNMYLRYLYLLVNQIFIRYASQDVATF